MSNHPRRRRRRRRSAPLLASLGDAAVGPTREPSCAACNGMTPDEVDALLLDRVSSRGHAVQAVGCATTRESWAYTVGVGETYLLPEIVVTGVEAEWAAGLLNTLVDEFGSSGMPAPGRGLQHRLELADHRHEFCLLSVDSDLVHRSSLLASAHRLSDVLGPPVGAVQVVLCDGRGRFPWQVGCRNADAAMLLDHPLESVRRLFA